MTISSETRKAGPFTGNDSTTIFPFTFKIFDATDVVVIKTNSTTEVETTLTNVTDYTVTLNADQDAAPGGTVTLPAALPTGYTLTLTSDVPLLQAVDLTNQGGFYPDVINKALDRLTIFAQQSAEQVGRAIKAPISSSTIPDNLIAELKADTASATASASSASASAATAAAYAASMKFMEPPSGGDDTAAIQKAIDDVAALTGGGTLNFTQGTYKHTGLTVPANVKLQGAGFKATVLDCTSTTANGITLGTAARFVSILDMTLGSSGASTGWAISGTSGVIGEFNIDRYMITGFLKGVDIWQAINSRIGQGRMQGQGRATAGGIGLRLGNSSTEISTTVTVGQTYFQDYETNLDNVYCPGLVCMSTVFETSKTAFKTAWSSYLYGCYWEANDTWDISAIGDGVIVFGEYGLDFAKVSLDGTATGRSQFYTKSGAFHSKNRFKWGANGDFGGALMAKLADGTGTSLRISVANPAKTGTGDDVHWESLSLDGRQYWWSKTLRFMEFDGTSFKVDAPFILGGGTALTKHLSATASLDFASIAANTTAELDITVTGAAAGDTVIVSPSGAPEAGLGWQGFAGTDLVTVRLSNETTAAIDPAARTWRVDVWKH